MITEKNNLHDMDTWMFFKWFFKAAVAIYLVTNTFDIVMAVFDIGQNVVAGAAGVISGDTNIDIESTLEQMRAQHGNDGYWRTAWPVHRDAADQPVPQDHVHSHHGHSLWPYD